MGDAKRLVCVLILTCLASVSSLCCLREGLSERMSVSDESRDGGPDCSGDDTTETDSSDHDRRSRWKGKH